jgi:hypothetical protein
MVPPHPTARSASPAVPRPHRAALVLSTTVPEAPVSTSNRAGSPLTVAVTSS